jgi:hypothetical protein
MLEFNRLGDVPPEVDRLLEGHVTVGRWSLGQILDHLGTALRLSMIHRPAADPDPRARVLRRRFFREPRFPEGLEAPHPRLLPAEDADPRAASEALREAIARWESAPGPFPDHPVLGALTKDEWTRFHCMHCAHHLGFAIPA